MRDTACIILFSIVLSLTNGSSAAPSIHLPDFANAVVNALNSPQFDTKDFCDEFASSKFRYSCNQDFPWKHLRQSKSEIVKTLLTSSYSGFLTIQFNSTTKPYIYAFTAKLNSDGWEIGLDDIEVWTQFSNKWAKYKYDFGEIRFAEEPKKETATTFIKLLNSDSRFLFEQLQNQDHRRIDVLVLNSQSYSTEIALKFDNSSLLSGGARKGFLLFTGNPENRVDSQILHELVHEFTVYQDSWGYSDSRINNAFVSEGFATWFQMPNLEKDQNNLPDLLKAPVSSAANSALDLATQFIAENDPLDLLDSNKFRDFDSKGYHPAYFVAAGVIDCLWAKNGLTTIKEVWNTDPARLRSAIVDNCSSAKEHVLKYLTRFRHSH